MGRGVRLAITAILIMGALVVIALSLVHPSIPVPHPVPQFDG